METLEEKIMSVIDDDIADIYKDRDCGSYNLYIPLFIHAARHLAIISRCLKDSHDKDIRYKDQ